MTHDVAAHTHDPDPPAKAVAPKPDSIWAREGIIDRLKELWETYSSTETAKILSGEFGVTISRNSVVGRLHRMGLTVNNKKELHPQTRIPGVLVKRRPTLRIINGGNNSKVLIETVEGDVAPLQYAPVEPRHLTLGELGPDDCRYPFGDSPFTFCGHKKLAGISYCAGHAALCHLPPTERNQRARGVR